LPVGLLSILKLNTKTTLGDCAPIYSLSHKDLVNTFFEDAHATFRTSWRVFERIVDTHIAEYVSTMRRSEVFPI